MAFEPGQSGNPNGRPPGPNALTKAARERIANDCDPIGFLGSVMNGEPQRYSVSEGESDAEAFHTPTLEQRISAARTLAGKLCPDAKDSPLTFTVGELTGPADAMRAMSNVIERMGTGELTPTEAASVMNVVGLYLKAWEANDLEQRLKALEDKAA